MHPIADFAALFLAADRLKREDHDRVIAVEVLVSGFLDLFVDDTGRVRPSAKNQPAPFPGLDIVQTHLEAH